MASEDLTLEQAHKMARSRWGRQAFASELDGMYEVGTYIGSIRFIGGRGSSFAEAVRNAKLPRTSRDRREAAVKRARSNRGR